MSDHQDFQYAVDSKDVVPVGGDFRIRCPDASTAERVAAALNLCRGYEATQLAPEKMRLTYRG